ncbi:MAG: SDR family oxidoreductase [Pyrinomonadaceae bacterium]|nr:SDR family oxidoreductase [Blastocatellia bacterium]MCW5955264.1 SDR family oxidoreductase [Pyrinomonadaceae bacterium]
MTLSSKSVAVVTGAASGIGRALAVRLAKEIIAGIAIADINEDGLAATASMVAENGIPVTTHVVDVGDLEQVKQFAYEVLERHARVTHLINNAGVGLFGTFEHVSIEDIEWLMRINFWGVVYGCKAFLPTLLEQDDAHIVNISSVFGFIAPEEQTAYCASKFAVRGFTESLRHEYRGTNLYVSSVHPGGVLTNIARNSKIGENTPEEWKQQGARFFDKVAKTSPDEAAETIVKGIKKRNPRILIGKDARAISSIARLFPKNYLGVIERIAGHKMSLRKK